MNPALAAGPALSPAAIVGGIVLLLWFAGVVVYYVWAILRYNVNFGLTNHEWKVLYPDLYGKNDAEIQAYRQRNQAFIEQQRQYADSGMADARFVVPSANPHANDSFGLPPGSVRGTLALTALVLFLTMEGVNFFAPGTEKASDQLVTAFMMVLAFYFGSRAIEVLQSRQSSSISATSTTSVSVGAAIEAPARGATAIAGTAPALAKVASETKAVQAVVAGAVDAGAAPIRAALASGEVRPTGPAPGR